MQASSGGAIGGPSAGTTTRRGRSSSLVSVTEIKENYNDALDKEITHNLNADWVNYKGELFLSLCGRGLGADDDEPQAPG